MSVSTTPTAGAGLLPPLADPTDQEAIRFGERVLTYRDLAGVAGWPARFLGGVHRHEGDHAPRGRLPLTRHPPADRGCSAWPRAPSGWPRPGRKRRRSRHLAHLCRH